MSDIQIVPDDVGVAAAQVLSDAMGNVSLNNRINTSDLERLALEGAREVGDSLKDVASVLSTLNTPLSLLLYVVAIALIIWVVLLVTEKVITIVRYCRGRRTWGRRPVSTYWFGFKRWLTGNNSNRAEIVYPEQTTTNKLNSIPYYDNRIPAPGDQEMLLLSSKPVEMKK